MVTRGALWSTPLSSNLKTPEAAESNLPRANWRPQGPGQDERETWCRLLRSDSRKVSQGLGLFPLPSSLPLKPLCGIPLWFYLAAWCCRKGSWAPLLSHQASGPWRRALSHRPSALRPKLLPRCGVPFVTFLDLVPYGFRQGEHLGSLGAGRNYFCTCEPGCTTVAGQCCL